MVNRDISDTMTLSQKILERDDIVLIGTGSISCIRTLYFQAKEIGKVHQFIPCYINENEYGQGKVEYRIKDSIKKAMNMNGVKGIVIYASCMDVITQIDFDNIINAINNLGECIVKVFYRGPLVKRRVDMKKNLENMLKSIPDSKKKIERKCTYLPPIAADLNGISSMLQQWNFTYNFLVTAGGCSGSIIRTDGIEKKYFLRKSRLNDIEVSLGCEEFLINGIKEDYLESEKNLCCIMGSGVPKFIGVDYEEMVENLKSYEIESIYLESDGFKTAPVAIAKALLKLGKTFLNKKTYVKSNKINLLGYSDLAIGSISKLDECIEYIKKSGYTFELWGATLLENQSIASLNWVVSTEGLPLAIWMKENFNIPYVTGIPIGIEDMNKWKNQINRIVEDNDENIKKISGNKTNDENDFNILIIGEPVLSYSIKKYIFYELGFKNIFVGAYTPERNLRKFYKSYWLKDGLICFDDINLLKEKILAVNVVIADPLYKEFINKIYKDAIFISVPYPMISGKNYIHIDYSILGEKGAKYIKDNILSIRN